MQVTLKRTDDAQLERVQALQPISSRKINSEPAFSPLGPCKLLMPQTLYAVPGHEANLYFENLVLSPVPGRYLFDVTCEKGIQHEKRWLWTPEEPGGYELKLEVRDLDDFILASSQTTIHVAPAAAGQERPVKLLCIGDSLTAASIYTGELLNLCARPGNPVLTLLGTQQNDDTCPGNRNEGYGGWRYESFVGKWQADPQPDDTPSMGSSPFLFLENGVPVLNFDRYIAESLMGVVPDFITLELGINDVFLATDKGRVGAVESMIRNAQLLVENIRAAAPRAQIGIVTLLPPSTSQNAFGETNGTMQTRWAYLKNQALANLRLMQVFGGRAAQNISLVPAYVNLDCEHNFPTIERSANARSDFKLQLANNEVHPSPAGYYQMADSIYAWLKWQLENSDEDA